MKKITWILCNFLLITVIGFSQTKYRDYKSYVQVREIDSSGYFITGEMLNKNNRVKYNFLNRTQHEYSSQQVIFWTNVIVINSANGSSTHLFSKGLFAIYPIYNTLAINKYDWGYYPTEKNNNSGMSENCLIFLVRSDELNKDGILDEEDPISIYLTTKTGSSLKRLTDASMNVTSWMLTKDSKYIIASIQTDTNNDKRFSDEDEVLYWINVEADLSTIKPPTIIQ